MASCLENTPKLTAVSVLMWSNVKSAPPSAHVTLMLYGINDLGMGECSLDGGRLKAETKDPEEPL